MSFGAVMQIGKFRSEPRIAFRQVTVYFQEAQNALARLGKSVADKSQRLREALRERENSLQNLLAKSLDAIVVTNSKIAKLRSRLITVFEKATPHFQEAQNALARLGRSVADKSQRLREALREKENRLQSLLANSLDALVGTNGKIPKLSSRLVTVLKKVIARLHGAQNTLARLGKSVADKPRRLREAHRERENSLQNLLTTSLDAIVVTNNHHRLVAANPKALDLFGISESNMRQFTIDAFLEYDQVREFDGNGSPLIRRKERHGRCTIRRLDGSFRVAEYVFIAHFIPLRHVSTFRDVTRQKVRMTFTVRLNPGYRFSDISSD
jgi:PAS domain S-box-containing protein